MFQVDKYINKGGFIAILLLIAFSMSSCSSNRRYSDSRRHNNSKVNKRVRYTKTSNSTKSTTKRISSVSRKRNNILGTAKQYMGTKYVYGGKRPNGFDCSGFVSWVMQQNGIDITGSSRMIAKKGRNRSLKSLEKGDLVFFGSGSKVTHIAIVVENDNVLKVIHSTTSRGVVIDQISDSKYWEKRFLFGKTVI